MDTLVIGIGEEHRHDYALGLVAVRELRSPHTQGIEFMESDGEATTLVDAWADVPLAIIVTAGDMGDAPGRIRRMGLHDAALTSNDSPMGEAMALARSLDRMPHRLLVFRVQIHDGSPGDGLSSPASLAVGEVISEIADLLVTQRWARQ
ncbi:hydrogenase maturation protease [Hamadaea flava]|uniref:Hydrogenase maturation protease n=1 Tax=Hamadaea flava TaxID=1742688 RepID=A0ABV8LTD6_9ACTN|nr:hydrogenase maturation protease [Hamadaea flava]MCP2328746.1 hydrogenase maturation protease [Hamadaea flava]